MKYWDNLFFEGGEIKSSKGLIIFINDKINTNGIHEISKNDTLIFKGSTYEVIDKQTMIPMFDMDNKLTRYALLLYEYRVLYLKKNVYICLS